jgi:thiol-disulfide isomerase/thioredoxin
MQNQFECRLLKPGKGNFIAQKKSVLLGVLLLLFSVNWCSGQVLTLSSPQPKMGLISFTYDPKGGKLENDTLKTATVLSTDGFDQKSNKVELIKDGAIYRGKFQVDSATLLLIFAFSANKVWDQAPTAGHLYPIYVDGQPVSGALTAMADFYISKNSKTIYGMEPNYQKAIDLLQEELKLHPEGKYKLTTLQKYYQARYQLNPVEGRTAILAAIKAIDQQSQISDVDHLKKYRLYEILGLKVEMENTLELITKQFPSSPVIFSRRYKDALTPRAAAEMEQLGHQLIADYNMVNGKEFTSYANSVYSALNQAYLKELNLPKFYFYLYQLSSVNLRLADLMSAATFFAETKRELVEAAQISNWGLRLIDTLTLGKSTLSQKRLLDKKTELTGVLGRIYYEQGQFDHAYMALKSADQQPGSKPNFISLYYGLVLAKKKEYTTAKPLLAAAIRDGNTDEEIVSAFKTAFLHDGGSLADYATALATLKAAADSNQRSILQKTILNMPAPNFSLTNNKGKRVALADYKGKIVVLDFWATWCVPCLEAFPGMNKLIKKYENDQDVVFLFVNTSETFTKDLTKNINAYLKKQGYNFQVLIDEKGLINGVNQYTAKTLYDANTIPLKVVIDKMGNIRFKSVGYLGSDEKVVAELSSFIEAAKM